MPLSTSFTSESINFDVEDSASRHSTDIRFTELNDGSVRSNSRRSAARQKLQLADTAPLSVPQAATAPDPESPTVASASSQGKRRSLSVSGSSTASDRSSPASERHRQTRRKAARRRSVHSDHTSLVSSATFPTVTATSPSLSVSRSVTAAVRARSPRVAAVLSSGGPQTRGRHSISPRAPDAKKAPPREMQGPPRYLQERGLTPSPRAVSSARHRRHSAGRQSSSHTSSPTAAVRRHKSRSRHKKDEDKAEKKRSSRHRHVSVPEITASRHQPPSAAPVSAAMRGHQSPALERRSAAREDRLQGRSRVMAPDMAAVDDDTTTLMKVTSRHAGASPSPAPLPTFVPSLSVHHLQQQPQSPSRAVNGSGVSPAGRATAGEADIRAPPPRATSPAARRAHSSLHPASHLTVNPPQRHGPGGGASDEAQDRDSDAAPRVPVLSAHGQPRRSEAGQEGGGPPTPAAWNASAMPSSAGPSSSPHRYAEPTPRELAKDDGRLGDRRGSGSSRPADVPSHPSHRFGPPPPSAIASGGWRAEGITTSGKDGPQGGAAGPSTRFLSTSPQLPSSSPIPNSYVARSFSSLLPGESTVLGHRHPPLPQHPNHRTSNKNNGSLSRGDGGADASHPQRALDRGAPWNLQAHHERQSSLAEHTARSGAAAYGAGGGRDTEELCGLDVAVMADAVEELPPPDTLEHYESLLTAYVKDQEQEQQQREKGFGNAMAATATLEREVTALFSLLVHIRLPSHKPVHADTEDPVEAATSRVVTVGDVKDEVALRTGIPAQQQCIVYESMALQDSLPVHLLVSAAAAADVAEDSDDDNSTYLSQRHTNAYSRLRLLCVPLQASAAPPATSPLRRRSALLSSHAEASAAMRGAWRGSTNMRDGNGRADGEDDLRALLLMSPASPSHTAAAADAADAEASTTFSRSRDAAAGETARRGAVPFTLSEATLRHQEALQARAEATGAAQQAVSNHIQRLRQLYASDKATSSPTLRGGDAAPHRSGDASSRDYLFRPEYQISSAGRVEHADPVVHALQQQLLLSQLTSPNRRITNPPPPTVTHTSATRSAANHALSSALVAALPAPPVRQRRDGAVAGVSASRFGVAPLPAATPSSSPQQQQQQQQHENRHSSPGAVSASRGFLNDAMEDGGVGASWLEGSTASAYSARVGRAVTVSNSVSPSAYDY